MSIDLLSLSASKLQRVISLKRKIERLEGKLDQLVGRGSKASEDATEEAPRKRRTMSPEARRKIAAAAKARWARYHAAKKQ